jgi:hypothetical protein
MHIDIEGPECTGIARIIKRNAEGGGGGSM